MNREVISFFDKFNCLAERCPENCCKSWDMPVDDETLDLYKNAQGMEGLKLQLSVKKNKEGDDCLRTFMGKCCNLGRDGLCKHQVKGKDEYMPLVCRLFPRNTVLYGDYCLGMLDLSCIEVARMLVETDGKLEFVNREEELQVFWEIKDVYNDFVEVLRKDLESILDFLWNTDGDIWQKGINIFAHCYGMHRCLVRDDVAGASKIDFDFEELTKGFEGDVPLLIRNHMLDATKAFFPMTFINDLIYQNIPEDYLLLYHRRIYLLFRSYKKRFGKISNEEADQIFMKLWDDICKKYDWIEDKLLSYFSYKIQMNYMNASIDYYVLEPLLLAMVNVQFLMVLLILEENKKEAITKQIYAELISENERLISHNKVLNGDIMRKFREELF